MADDTVRARLARLRVAAETSGIDDEELRWAAGVFNTSRDEAAFAVIWQTMHVDLTRFALGLLGDRLAADDAVQDVFVTLLNAQLEDAASIKSWLFRGVQRQCMKVHRTSTRRDRLLATHAEKGATQASAGDAIEAAIDARYYVARLREMLRPEEYQFLLRVSRSLSAYGSRTSWQPLVSEFHEAEGTLRQRYFRLLKRIRRGFGAAALNESVRGSARITGRSEAEGM